MKTLIISDIHFGNGGSYDAYAGGEALPALLERFAAPENRVVIAGDSVDFLMNEDPLKLQVSRAVSQAREIAEAPDTRAAFLALGEVLAAGGEVVIRVGNHDVELVLPEVQEVFRGALGQSADVADRLAFQMGDRPWLLEEKGVKVLVSHGEHNDDWNKLAYPKLIDAKGQVRPRRFVYPPGSRLVKTLLNPLKKTYEMRFADLLKPDFQGAALTALAVNPRAVEVVFQGSTVTLMWQLFRRAGSDPSFDPREGEPDLGLHQRLDEAGLTPEEMAALRASVTGEGDLSFAPGEGRAAEKATIKVLKNGLRAFARVQRKLVGDRGEAFFDLEPSDAEWHEAQRLAQKFGAQAVVLGHSHAARFRASSALTFINTGTWIWLMELPPSDADDTEWVHFLEMLRSNPGLDPSKGEAPPLLGRFTGALLEPHSESGADLSLIQLNEEGELETLGSQHLARQTG